jgi:hypothetical protein
VLSCDPHQVLLNGRVPELPRPQTPNAQPPDRNSPLAMRNPSFAFAMWAGAAPAASAHTTSQRDFVWRFSTRGQFVSMGFNIANASGTTGTVSPQSMRFIESLGQLAIVDGASQGLVLVDLNTVTLAHSPYF